VPIVHVAGTKGKGSTAAMLGAILTAAGYRTGVFTSPHLERIEQRMAVDGRACSSEELVGLLDRIKPAVEAMDREVPPGDPDEIGPTYFEITTAMALLHFSRYKVDIAVLEVGLGGRLDSTNVCRPQVAVITSISFDHTRQLGTTLRSIAREKAGIVKAGVPVVSGVIDEGPREVIREICRRRGCRLVELGVDFDFDYGPPSHLERAPAVGRLDFRRTAEGYTYRHLPLRLLGYHQADNAAVALATLAELGQGGWEIPEEAIRTGLAEVVCPARVEVVARRPAVVLDVAHNLASVRALVRVLDESFSVARRLLVLAASREKDLHGMLAHVLGWFDEVIFTRYLDNPRAVPPEQLAALARELTGTSYAIRPGPADAWDAIRAQASPEDLICVTGSFFVAAEIRRHLTAQPQLLSTETETKESA
jgi:dihydrofolate synthase/folylpolyglutamate synthase